MIISCNGMMRSGSTLQYNLVRCLSERMGCGIGEGYFAEKDLPIEKVDKWAKDDYYHVIKMHELHSRIIQLLETKSIYIIYIYRDIRDVAVSAKRQFNYKSEEQLLAGLERAILFHYKLVKIPGVLIQKYENVVKNIPSAVQDYCSFLSIDSKESDIESVIDKCSIDNALKIANNPENYPFLKMKEFLDKPYLPFKKISAFLQNRKLLYKFYDERTLLHNKHISKDKGKSGIWKYNLSKSEIALIEDHFGTWLTELGYDLKN